MKGLKLSDVRVTVSALHKYLLKATFIVRASEPDVVPSDFDEGVRRKVVDLDVGECRKMNKGAYSHEFMSLVYVTEMRGPSGWRSVGLKTYSLTGSRCMSERSRPSRVRTGALWGSTALMEMTPAITGTLLDCTLPLLLLNWSTVATPFISVRKKSLPSPVTCSTSLHGDAVVGDKAMLLTPCSGAYTIVLNVQHNTYHAAYGNSTALVRFNMRTLLYGDMRADVARERTVEDLR